MVKNLIQNRVNNGHSEQESRELLRINLKLFYGQDLIELLVEDGFVETEQEALAFVRKIGR